MNFWGFVTTLSVWVISAVAHLPVALLKVVLVPLGRLSAENDISANKGKAGRCEVYFFLICNSSQGVDPSFSLVNERPSVDCSTISAVV